MLRFGEVTTLTTQLCANVHAINTCRHFYLSYIYTRVSFQQYASEDHLSGKFQPGFIQLVAEVRVGADHIQ